MNLLNKFDENGNQLSPELPKTKINYLIDIDGTICEDIPNEQPARMITAKELPGAKEAVNGFFDAGHNVCFFTSRAEEHRTITENWLKEHGFNYHQIIFNKPRGGNYYFIDDKVEKSIKFKGEYE